MKRFVYAIIAVIVAVGSLFVLTACDGPNSAAWSVVTNNNEQVLSNGFSQTVGSARSGHRNRTFELTAAQLANIRIDSTSTAGTITLTISANGELDGTEIVMDISDFNGTIDAGHLGAGRIRFQLRHEETRNTSTTITWN